MKNKEIEKMLKYLKNNTYIPDETKRKYKILHRDEVNLLLSYIEQLEKEIEFLKVDNPNANIKHFEMLKENKRKIDDLRYQNKQLEKRNKELYEGFMATQEELTDYATKNEQLEADYKEANESIIWWTNRFNAVERDKKQLENNRDKAIEYLHQGKFRFWEMENILKGDSDDTR